MPNAHHPLSYNVSIGSSAGDAYGTYLGLAVNTRICTEAVVACLPLPAMSRPDKQQSALTAPLRDERIQLAKSPSAIPTNFPSPLLQRIANGPP